VLLRVQEKLSKSIVKESQKILAYDCKFCRNDAKIQKDRSNDVKYLQAIEMYLEFLFWTVFSIALKIIF
jgi:hypothetical protein